MSETLIQTATDHIDVIWMSINDFITLYDKDIYQAVQLEQAVEAHCTQGGTAKKAIWNQIRHLRTQLAEIDDWLQSHELSNVGGNHDA